MADEIKKGDIRDLAIQAFTAGYNCGASGYSLEEAKELFNGVEKKSKFRLPRDEILKFMEISHKAGASGLTWEETLEIINESVKKVETELEQFKSKH